MALVVNSVLRAEGGRAYPKRSAVVQESKLFLGLDRLFREVPKARALEDLGQSSGAGFTLDLEASEASVCASLNCRNGAGPISPHNFDSLGIAGLTGGR